MSALPADKIDSIRGVYGRTYDEITAPVSKDGTTWLPSGVLTSESTSYANRLKSMGVALEPGAQGSVKGLILCPWTSFGYTGNPGPGDDPAQSIDLEYFEDALQAHLDPANHGGTGQFGTGKKAIAFVNYHSWAYANTGNQNKINLSSRATYGSGGSYYWANTSGYSYSSSFNILNTAAQNWYVAWLEGVIAAIENSAICQQYLAGLMGGETADGKLEEIYNAGLFPGTSWSQAALDAYWVREMQVYSDNLASYPWFAGVNFLSGTKPRAFDDFRTSTTSTQGYETVMQDAFPNMQPTVGIGGPDWGGFGYKIDTASDDNQTYGPRWGQVIGSTRPVLAHRELLSNETWDLPVETVRNSFTSFASWAGVSQEHKDEITGSWDREIARNGSGTRGTDAEGSFDQSYHVARAICGTWCDSGVGTGVGLDSQATLNAAVQKWAPLFYEGNPLSLGGGRTYREQVDTANAAYIAAKWALTPDYYVSKSGNDTTGDGSSGTPWRTIAKANTIATAGEVVQVGDGDWSEEGFDGNIALTDGVIWIAESRWGATFNYPGGYAAGNIPWKFSGDDVEFIGFEADGQGLREGSTVGVANTTIAKFVEPAESGGLVQPVNRPKFIDCHMARAYGYDCISQDIGGTETGTRNDWMFIGGEYDTAGRLGLPEYGSADTNGDLFAFDGGSGHTVVGATIKRGGHNILALDANNCWIVACNIDNEWNQKAGDPSGLYLPYERVTGEGYRYRGGECKWPYSGMSVIANFFIGSGQSWNDEEQSHFTIRGQRNLLALNVFSDNDGTRAAIFINCDSSSSRKGHTLGLVHNTITNQSGSGIGIVTYIGAESGWPYGLVIANNIIEDYNNSPSGIPNSDYADSGMWIDVQATVGAGQLPPTSKFLSNHMGPPIDSLSAGPFRVRGATVTYMTAAQFNAAFSSASNNAQHDSKLLLASTILDYGSAELSSYGITNLVGLADPVAVVTAVTDTTHCTVDTPVTLWGDHPHLGYITGTPVKINTTSTRVTSVDRSTGAIVLADAVAGLDVGRGVYYAGQTPGAVSEWEGTPTAPPAEEGSFLQAPGGELCVLAENYHETSTASGKSWTPITLSSLDGMRATPDSGANINTSIESTSPRLTYNFSAVETGVHYVHVLGGGYGTDGQVASQSNSIHVGLDGAVTFEALTWATAPWGWANANWVDEPATVNIGSVGAHTLDVWMREDGSVVRKIVLSKSATLPTGDGPAESFRLTLDPAEAPTVGVVLDPVAKSATVTLSSATPGAAIYYAAPEGGVVANPRSFTETGGTGLWGTQTILVSLGTGSHTVEMASTGFGGPNVDSLTLLGPSTQTVYDAALAVLGGTANIGTAYVGHTGIGYVQFSSEGTITWTITVPTDGVYQLEIRYSLASGAISMDVALNSGTVGSAAMVALYAAPFVLDKTTFLRCYTTADGYSDSLTVEQSINPASVARIGVQTLPVWVNAGAQNADDITTPSLVSFVSDIDASIGGYTNGWMRPPAYDNTPDDVIFGSRAIVQAGETRITTFLLDPGQSVRLWLGFVEQWYEDTAGAKRLLDVAVNGSSILSGYDFFADCSAIYEATYKDCGVVTADGSGLLAVAMTGAATTPDSATVCVIGLTDPATTTGRPILTSGHRFNSNVLFGWIADRSDAEDMVATAAVDHTGIDWSLPAQKFVIPNTAGAIEATTITAGNLINADKWTLIWRGHANTFLQYAQTWLSLVDDSWSIRSGADSLSVIGTTPEGTHLKSHSAAYQNADHVFGVFWEWATSTLTVTIDGVALTDGGGAPINVKNTDGGFTAGLVQLWGRTAGANGLDGGVSAVFLLDDWDAALQADPENEIDDLWEYPGANQAPVLAPIGSKSIEEGQALAFTATATDPDGTTPEFSFEDVPSGATFVDQDDGSADFAWTPGTDDYLSSPYTMTVTVSDGVLTDSEVVSITVTAPGTVAPPANAAAVGASETTISVTFDNPLAGVVEVEVGEVLDGSSATSPYTITGLDAWTDYAIRVRVNATGNSSYVDLGTVKTLDTTDPAAPANLEATYQGVGLWQLDWDVATDPTSNGGASGVSGYGVSDGQLVGSASATVAMVDGEDEDFAAYSIDEAGNESADSDPVHILQISAQEYDPIVDRPVIVEVVQPYPTTPTGFSGGWIDTTEAPTEDQIGEWPDSSVQDVDEDGEDV